MKCFCRSDNGRIAIERPTGLGTYDYQCDNCHRYYRDGLVSKDQRIAFALKQIRGQTIVQPRFYGGATLRRSRQVRRAESFGAESDRDDTEYLEAMQGIITNFEDSFCPSCSWGLDKHTIVNFNAETVSKPIYLLYDNHKWGQDNWCYMGTEDFLKAEQFESYYYTFIDGEDESPDVYDNMSIEEMVNKMNTFLNYDEGEGVKLLRLEFGEYGYAWPSSEHFTKTLVEGIIEGKKWDGSGATMDAMLGKAHYVHAILNDAETFEAEQCKHQSYYPYMNAESFGAEMDGKKLIASSYDLADGSMMVGVGTETLDVDDPDFMEMMIDEDGKIKYFTLPIGLDKWERSYRIKPTHYGKMKTQNETNEAVGGDFIRTDGEGKYAESFGAEFIKWSGEAEGPECFICGTLNPKGDFEGQDNTCDECDSQWTYDEYGEEGEGYYKSIEKTMTVKGLSDIIEMMMEDGKGDYSIIVAYHRNGDTVVSDIKSWSENGLNLQLNEEDFYDFVWGAESFASYDMPISERQRYRIRKLGGRIDKAMNRSDASRYIKSLMAVPLHAETADCPTCQGWGWNEELDIVCDADGCIGGWFIPKKPSLFQRGLESGLGIGAGIAGVALVMGLLGGSAGFAYEEMTKRRD